MNETPLDPGFQPISHYERAQHEDVVVVYSGGADQPAGAAGDLGLAARTPEPAAQMRPLNELYVVTTLPKRFLEVVAALLYLLAALTGHDVENGYAGPLLDDDDVQRQEAGED